MISTEFEERLREEMRHATTGISAPSGLVRRARRGRRRRIVSRVSAASAAVAVAVAGAVIVSNGTTGASRDSGTYTTAYVVKHVESALDAVNKIAYMHYTSHFLAPMDVWAYDGPRGQAYRADLPDLRLWRIDRHARYGPLDGLVDRKAVPHGTRQPGRWTLVAPSRTW